MRKTLSRSSLSIFLLCFCQDVTIYGGMLFDHSRAQEEQACSIPSSGAHRIDDGRSLHDFSHTVRKGLCVCRRECQAGIIDNFGESTNLGHNHESSAHHLFNCRETGGFLANRWHHDHANVAKYLCQSCAF